MSRAATLAVGDAAVTVTVLSVMVMGAPVTVSMLLSVEVGGAAVTVTIVSSQKISITALLEVTHWVE